MPVLTSNKQLNVYEFIASTEQRWFRNIGWLTDDNKSAQAGNREHGSRQGRAQRWVSSILLESKLNHKIHL